MSIHSTIQQTTIISWFSTLIFTAQFGLGPVPQHLAIIHEFHSTVCSHSRCIARFTLVTTYLLIMYFN